MLKKPSPRTSSALAYRRMVLALALSSLLFLQLLAPVVLAVNLNTAETPVTQNFDSIGTSATAALPADFMADKNVGRRVVGAYSTAGTATEQTAGGGSPTISTGGIYNCGSGANNTGSERAVGFLGSGSVNGGNLYAKYTNTTGASITALRISYDVEKYRNGTNAAGFRFQLFYSTTGASGSWTSAGANFTTAFAGADANNNSFAVAPGATVSVSNQFLNLPTPIANNSDIYLAWNYGVTTGSTDTNAQLLAIDNISVTPLGGPISADGVRTTDIQGTDDGGFAMVLQPDGKTVVGGYAVDPLNGDKEFALVRYKYDGTLDSTFGTGGKVVTDFNGTSDRIWGMALQTDGKIVAVGETFDTVTSTNDVAIARYTSAGALDATFNGTGKVTTDYLAGNNSAYAVAMSGTNIIVAGAATVSGNYDFMVSKYTTAGVLDPTFGTLGTATVGFSGYNDVARAVAIQSADSKIVLGGYSRSGSGDDDFALARFNTNGTIDSANFGLNGTVATDIFGGSGDQAFGMALDSSSPQKIILVGSAFNNSGNKDFAVVRYTSTGALDVSNFAGQGIVTTDFANSPDVAQAVALQSDGKIVVGGFSRYSASSDDFALVRYTSGGVLDTTFDGDGKLTTTISNADERIYGVGVEYDGKIVAGGFAAVVGSNPVSRNFALARYNSTNGSLDATSALSNQPDLYLTKTGPADSVIVGNQFSYTVTVVNRGPGNATNVVITDTLPVGLTYVSSTPSNGNSGESLGTVTNNVGALAANQTATLTITVSTTTTNTYTNTASVTSTETDLSPGNNTDSVVTRVIGLTDMSFVPSTVVGGCQNSMGTVTLSGPAPAGGATVTIVTADPAAQPPPSVVVPAGQTSVSFTVTTSPVAVNKTVRMEAALGTSRFVRRLIVNTGQCN